MPDADLTARARRAAAGSCRERAGLLGELIEEVERLNRVAWGVVHNADRVDFPGSERRMPLPLWAVVMRLTGQGSTVATRLCVEFGRDPDEVVGKADECEHCVGDGDYCEHCNREYKRARAEHDGEESDDE